jgi:hypothetical protein
MDLAQGLSIAIKVLADWRVVFIALAVIVVWAALRYVGSVYHRRPKTKPRPPPAPAGAEAGAGAKARAGRTTARGGRAERPEDEPDSGMIE